MKKSSICIIGVYFGTLPAYFNLWLKSCECNSDIDFLIITDNELKNLPGNVKSVKMTLEEMKKRAENVLGFDVSLDRPYKCCDFKVIYGKIFGDFVENYDFWGHCDFDLIFGDLRTFITEDILEKYDKIFDLGHLSLYRNTDEVNSRYKLEGSFNEYTKVYSNPEIFVFDEVAGIYPIYKRNGLPMYEERVYADIFPAYSHFRAIKIKNYIRQVFYWENGKVLRSYKEKGTIKTDEFAYIHFQKRPFNKTLDNNVETFYISKDGFAEKKRLNTPTSRDIKRINPCLIFVEIKERIICTNRFIVKKSKGLKRRILNVKNNF